MARPISIEGVGAGTSQCTHEALVPIALEDGTQASFRCPVVPQSEIPALLGLKSLQSMRELIDVHGRKPVLPGPGGYKLPLSPGSLSHIPI